MSKENEFIRKSRVLMYIADMQLGIAPDKDHKVDVDAYTALEWLSEGVADMIPDLIDTIGEHHEANIKEYMKDMNVSYEQAEKELEVHSMHGKADIDPDTFMAIYNDTENEDDGI